MAQRGDETRTNIVNEVKTIITRIDGPPPWATEETLKDMRSDVKQLAMSVLKKNNDKYEERAADSISSATKEQTGIFRNFLGLAGKKDRSDEEIKKSGNKLDIKHNDILWETNSAMRNLTGSFKGAFSSIDGLLEFSGAAYKAAGTIFGTDGLIASIGFTKVGLLGMVGAADTLISWMIKTTDAELDLYNSGVSLNGNLLELIDGAGDAGMGLVEFSALMKKHTQLVTILNGPRAYGLLLKQTQSQAKLNGYYGMTLQQLNEDTSDYLDTLRIQGIVGKLQGTTLADRTNDFLYNLTQYSEAFGVSREQLMKQFKAEQEDPLWSTYKSGMTEQAQKTEERVEMLMNASMGSAAPAMVKAFQQSVMGPYGMVSDLSVALGQQGHQDLATKFVNLSKSLETMSPKEATDAMADFAEGVQNMDGVEKQRLVTLAATMKGDDTLSRGLRNLAELIQGTGSVEDIKKAYAKMLEPPTELALAKLAMANTWTEVTNKFNQVFGDFEVKLAPALISIMHDLTEFMDYLDGFANNKITLADVASGILNMLIVGAGIFVTAVAVAWLGIPGLVVGLLAAALVVGGIALKELFLHGPIQDVFGGLYDWWKSTWFGGSESGNQQKLRHAQEAKDEVAKKAKEPNKNDYGPIQFETTRTSMQNKISGNHVEYGPIQQNVVGVPTPKVPPITITPPSTKDSIKVQQDQSKQTEVTPLTTKVDKTTATKDQMKHDEQIVALNNLADILADIRDHTQKTARNTVGGNNAIA